MRGLLIVLAGALVAGLAAVSSCGGADPFCGDGRVDLQLGEKCDDKNDDETDGCLNNCTLRVIPSLTLKWAFNDDETLGFTGDSCVDVGAANVEVEIAGAGGTFTKADSCGLLQVVYQDIPSSTYQVTMRITDREGALVTKEPITGTINFLGTPGEQFELVVSPDSWIGPFDGTFYFRISWAGMDCAEAVPPVVDQVLTLSQKGVPVSQLTKSGDPLDGTGPNGACRGAAEQFPESALAVPFGAADFKIEGFDQNGDVQFEQTFPTFIGAGVFNPEYSFDVASLSPGADAGPMDGG